MKRLLALLLACVMLLCCGCGSRSLEELPEAEPTATPIPTPNVPAAPVTVVDKAPKEMETVDVTVLIHGDEEVIPMTPVSGGFTAKGGPKFTLLVDRSRYQINDVGGYCYITLPTGMSGDVYAELGFRAGISSDSIGTEILDEYGVMGVKEAPVKEWLGDLRVKHIRGETVQNVFDVYLIDTQGGCMTAVLSTTTETKAHRARLMATLESLEITE